MYLIIYENNPTEKVQWPSQMSLHFRGWVGFLKMLQLIQNSKNIHIKCATWTPCGEWVSKMIIFGVMRFVNKPKQKFNIVTYTNSKFALLKMRSEIAHASFFYPFMAI